MFTPLKPPRGSAAQVAMHTGAEGSIVVNTDAKTIHVHDGATPGGFALSKVGHQHTKNEIVGFLGYLPVDPSTIGQANGVAPLDSTGKVPASMIPGGVGGGGVSDAGDLTGTTLAANVVNSSLTSVGVLQNLSVVGVISGSVSGSASKLATARNIVISGDVDGSASFDGSSDINITVSLDSVNGTPVENALKKITVNAKGQIIDTGDVTLQDLSDALGFTPVSQSYVDGVASNFTQRPGVRFASDANLAGTYNNGSTGADATLSGTGSIPAIGGGTPSLNDRVALMYQTNGVQNGIYKLTQVNPWVLTRDGGLDDVKNGAMVLVAEGTHAGEKWIQITPNPITLGTSALQYTMFQAAATAYQSGAGISVQNNTITNTGVRSLAGTTNQINISAATGAITASLTPSVTITGTMTANAFAGSGASLTGLNASNLASGTVPTARLGTGTADGTTFLSGDGTWKAPSVSVNALAGTGSNPRVSGTKGIYAGVDSGGSPSAVWNNTSAAAAARASHIYVNNSGVLGWALMSDDFSSATNFLTVNRSGNTASSITFAGTAFAIQANTSIAGTLNVSSVITGNGSGLTALNASNLASGTVPTARLGTGTASNQTYLRGDGTWAVAASNALVGTGLITRTAGTAGVYIGIDNAALPLITISNPQAASGSRMTQIYVDNAGSFTAGFANDAPNSQINWMKVDRSGMTATLITFTASAMTINAPVTATSFAGVGTNLTALNASNLSSGTVAVARLGSGTANNTTFLRGDGTWQVVNMGAATTLTATGALTFSALNAADGIYIGRRISTSGPPSMYFTQTTSNADARMWRFQTFDDGGGNGAFVLQTVSDADNATGQVLTFNRSGLTPNLVTVHTNLTVSGTITGNGSAITALNASNLSTGTVPTARLGSGTANSSSFLRGDGTWAAVNTTTVTATGSVSRTVASSAVFAGAVGGNPVLSFANATPAAGSRMMTQWVDTSGTFRQQFEADDNSGAVVFMQVTRSGTTPTGLTLTATNITLSGAVTATSIAGTHTGDGSGLTALNASNLGSGTVPAVRLGSGTANNTTFLRGDGTWASPTTTATTLAATGQISPSIASNSVSIGVGSDTVPRVWLINAGATTNVKASAWQSSGTGGTVSFNLYADDLSTNSAVLSIARSGNTATNITLTGTAITLTGAVTGTSFSGIGTNLTALNASNLGSGTVPTARLGSGTADSTTYLRGDGTWATVAATSVDAGTLTGTTLSSTVTTASLTTIQPGPTAINTPGITLALTGGNANSGGSASPGGAVSITGGLAVGISSGGAVNIAGGGSSSATGGSVNINGGGSGNTSGIAGSVNITGGNIGGNGASVVPGAVNITAGSTGSGAVPAGANVVISGGATASTSNTGGNTVLRGGLNSAAGGGGGVIVSTGGSSYVERLKITGAGEWQLAGVGGSAGQVLTSNGAGAAPTWTTPSVTALSATATVSPSSSATTGAFAAVGSSGPYYILTNASATAGIRSSHIQTLSTGNIVWTLDSDDFSTNTPFMTVARSGNTASSITLATTTLNLTGLSAGLQLNGSAGNAGQVLTSNGAGAAPTWQSVSGGTALFGTGSVSGYSATTSAINIGNQGIFMVNGSSTTDNHVVSQTVTNAGAYNLNLVSDSGTAATVMSIARSGNTATNFTVTATAITLTGAVTGTSFSGVGTNLTALNASNLGSGTVPTARLGTGTADATTYLRGDGTWQTVAGGNPTANNIQAASGTTSASFVTGNQTGASASGAITVGSGDTSGGTSTGNVTIKSGNSSVGATTSGTISIVTGNVPASQSSGAINLTTGTNLTGGGGPTGSITLTTGSSTSAGGTAGNISLVAGTGASTSGYVAISTASTQRVRFLASGAWSVGTDAVSTGATGQVLTSNGSAAAPTWQTVSAVVTQIPRVTTFDANAKGKRVAVTAGFTVPNNTYAAGDYFSFYNDSAADILITQASGLTLWLDGTTQTGNRTLRARGTCSIWFNSATEAVITGSVL